LAGQLHSQQSDNLYAALFFDEVYFRFFCLGKDREMYRSSETVYINGTTNLISHAMRLTDNY